MSDGSIRIFDRIQLIGGLLFLSSFFILLGLASSWRNALDWLVGPLVTIMGVGAITTITAFFIQGGQKTREDRVESLRGKVAWGEWAAEELERIKRKDGDNA